MTACSSLPGTKTCSSPVTATTGWARAATAISWRAAPATTGWASPADAGSMFGDDGNDTLLGVGTINNLVGGAGDDWVGVSGNTNLLFGGSGNDYVAATGTNNVLDGGPGNDQLVAAAGHSSNLYAFRPGSGQDSITGFEGVNGDFVDLRGFGLADLPALAAVISQVGADTVITLNGADILTLKNIVAAPVGQRFLFRLSGR